MAITRNHKTCLVLTLLLSAVLGLAVPIIVPSVVSRRQVCSNAPTTIAGTLFDRQTSVSPLLGTRSTTDAVRWCAQNSQVYILLTQSGAIHTVEIAAVLASAWQRVSTHLETLGDGLLPGDFFEQFNHVALRVWNANNHQTSWGVLSAALLAMKDFIVVRGGMGAVVFKIFDGNNQVGQGRIYYATTG